MRSPSRNRSDTREARSDQDDPEGAVTCYQATVVRALCAWHAASGDPQALETAGRLVRYILKPHFWTGGCSPWTEAGGTDQHNAREIRAVHGGAERKPAALFQGHQAGMTYTFTGLPYEGKVVLHNEGCHSLWIRIPRWVDRKAIACSVDGRKAAPFWAGNFLTVSGLGGEGNGDDRVPDGREGGNRPSAHAQRGAALVGAHRGIAAIRVTHARQHLRKVEFPNREKFTHAEPVCPVFQRDGFRAGGAPMKNTVRYVATKLVPWSVRQAHAPASVALRAAAKQEA